MQTSNNLVETKTNPQSLQENNSIDYLELAKQLFIDKIYSNCLKDFIIKSDYRDISFEFYDISIKCTYFGDGFQFIVNKKHYHINFICLFDDDKIETYQYRGQFIDLFNIILALSEYIKNDPNEFEHIFAFEYGKIKQHLIYGIILVLGF